MAVAEDRTGRRVLLLAVGCLCIMGAALWIYYQVQFQVFQPRTVQQRLFGTAIAGWGDLRRASNGCCAMDSSGILEWTYTIPAGQAATLVRRCRFPDGRPRPFVSTERPYYDAHSRRCIVAAYSDSKAAEAGSAEVSGRSLIVRLFYDDPELVDADFEAAAPK